MFKLRSRKNNRSEADQRKKTTSRPNRHVTSERERASWARNVDWGRARIRLVVGVFCLLWVGLWSRAWYLQMIEGPRLAERARRQHMASELVTGRRGMIYDRNGQVLARSVEARSVYARPQDIEDFQAMAIKLGPILGQDPQKLYAELSQTKRRFVWLRRKVDDYTADHRKVAQKMGEGAVRP